MNIVWYLEHVTTGHRLDLQNGSNLVGRHSSCGIVLDTNLYYHVSRRHVIIIVGDEGVAVIPLNPLNGTFINGRSMFSPLTVAEGATIGLGTPGTLEITGNHAIFALKKESR